ncbi:50S ribosomal protein L21 [candidate division WWE3 bacterium RIFOXYD1_FULL_43_17]|uniref:Large ribosomal subunit protein bL21 n=3 Tax=Katanobacteria TaxID=422282 RepID=A0A1F4XB12_UNCKA|nr:MAG: 50S ribosomal protein L21 [candidate division WWE3 bacterium RIFOXYD1_FULL_43_17]
MFSMDKYAIIKIGSAQYKVHEGDTLTVDNQNGKVNAEVLLFSDGKETILGDPTVKGASVTIKITGATRGDKIVVGRFKSKSRYRKGRGYRDTLSELLVEKIQMGGKKAEEEKQAAEAPKKVGVAEEKKPIVKAAPKAAAKKTVKKTVKKETK